MVLDLQWVSWLWFNGKEKFYKRSSERGKFVCVFDNYVCGFPITIIFVANAFSTKQASIYFWFCIMCKPKLKH